MNVIECNHVWKKYTKGEKIYSLRDAIPNFTKRLFFGAAPKTDELSGQEFWALRDVSFEVRRGEVMGIIGPNGAGKSTILKLLSRIIRPNKGEFAIRGRLSALIEITAGFHPDFTGRENVYFNGSILGMSRKEIDSKFDEIVDFSGVEEFIDTPVKRYSSGMYARLGFAVAAHVNPDVLLVDEVLAVGDINFQAKCAEKMRQLLKSGTTIALVSHNIPLVQSICSRIVLLDHGQVLKTGTPEEVIPHYQNIVFKKSEEELKKKISADHRINVQEDAQMEISDVALYGDDQTPKDHFYSGESLSVRAGYETDQAVQDPIFSCKIIRADGVVCCSSNTKDADYAITNISGKGSMTIDFGVLHLSPGIYHLEVSVWDRDMIHPYAFSKREIFRIKSESLILNDGAVFLPKVKWLSNGR